MIGRDSGPGIGGVGGFPSETWCTHANDVFATVVVASKDLTVQYHVTGEAAPRVTLLVRNGRAGWQLGGHVRADVEIHSDERGLLELLSTRGTRNDVIA